VTDQQFFQGELSWLSILRELVDLPLLRKDFIIDPLQVRESRAAGADAILLIAAILSRENLQELLDIAADQGLECLVEVRFFNIASWLFILRVSNIHHNTTPPPAGWKNSPDVPTFAWLRWASVFCSHRFCIQQ